MNCLNVDSSLENRSNGHIVQPNYKAAGRKEAHKKMRQFVVGDAVYVRDQEHGWSDGIIKEVENKNFTVALRGNQQLTRVSEVDVAARSTGQQVENVCNLSQLHPISTPAVLSCIRTRYTLGEIYTRAGSVLLALNPFKPRHDLYTAEVMQKYHSTAQESQAELPPHIYQVALAAQQHLLDGFGESGLNQSIIVSGESGAGKTVSARHLMQFLAASSCMGQPNLRRKSMLVGCQVEKRILESNPVLEAFGNASTLRNDNSSRFGKYIELQFARTGRLTGANLHTYLLEKTRVVHQAPGEDNFHIFHQLIQSRPAQLHHALPSLDQNGDPICYRFAEMQNRDAERDTTAWCALLEALSDIGVTEAQQISLFELLAAILHLGNIELTRDEEDEDVCHVNQTLSASSLGLRTAAQLLGLSADSMEKTFTHRRITASHRRRQSVFHRPCDPSEAACRCDCLAKLIYHRLFMWLVDTINTSMRCSNQHHTIGILDIYGFESFNENSLEQLCINYANERLQQHFVAHFLRDLQREYVEEALSWSFTDFPDNQLCVQLLDASPISVFSILNEECQLNRATDPTPLTDRLLTTLRPHKHLATPPTNTSHRDQRFLIRHYAAPVIYTVNGLIEKNKDNIPDELLELLHTSQNALLLKMLPPMGENNVPGKKSKSVLAKFKQSLDGLMRSLENTHPHYVRCIKPNTRCQADSFHGEYVLSQLKENGIVQTVEINKKAHPTRMAYSDFLQQFNLILRSGCESDSARRQHVWQKVCESNPTDRQKLSLSTVYSDQEDDKENMNLIEPHEVLYKHLPSKRRRTSTPKAKLRRRTGMSSTDHGNKLCTSILSLAFGASYRENPALIAQYGRSKIFLTHGKLEQLMAVKNRLLSLSAAVIQARWRGFVERRRYHQTLKSIRLIQSNVRRFLSERREAQRLRDESAAAAQYLSSPHPHHPGLDTTPAINHVRVRFAESPDVIGDCFHTPAANLEQFQTPPTSRKPLPTQLSFDRTPTNQGSPLQGYVTPLSSSRSSHLDRDDSFVITADQTEDELTYNISPSPSRNHPASCSAGDAFRTVAAAISAAFLTHSRFQLTGAFAGLPYFEAGEGLVTRRRMPRVAVRFHTKPNSVLRHGHLMSRREFQCSLSDCLDEYD